MSNLREAAATTREQFDELISQSEEQSAMVRQLERQYETNDLRIVSEQELPSGDEIAAELDDTCGVTCSSSGAPSAQTPGVHSAGSVAAET